MKLMDTGTGKASGGDRFRRLVRRDAPQGQSPAAASSGMDAPLARKPAWPRYGLYVLACVILAGVWLLAVHAHVYPAAVNRITIACATGSEFRRFDSTISGETESYG